MPGVLPSTMRLAHKSRNLKVEVDMSRSVRTSCLAPVPVCPTVRQRALLFSDPLKHRPLGVSALLPTTARMLRRFKGSSLTDTLVLFPKGAFYFGTGKHDSVVKYAVSMIAYQHEKVKNHVAIRRARQRSHCGYQRLLWGAFRCRCDQDCSTGNVASHSTAVPTTPTPNKEGPFSPVFLRRG